MTTLPTEGGGERLPKPRESCRMIAALAKDPLWVESLTPEMRRGIVEKLQLALQAAESPREIASVARAIGALEMNDIAKTKVVLDSERDQDTAQPADVAASIVRAVHEIQRIEDGLSG